jgi:homoserine dehydrogenase
MGCVVKLLAICERVAAGAAPGGAAGVSVRVHPAMIPNSHPLAGVREAFNAVFVEASAAGQLMFYGPGAGGDPPRPRPRRRRRRRPAPGGRRAGAARVRLRRPARPADGAGPDQVLHQSRRPDRPGVLAQVAGVFAEHAVSIEQVRQETHVDDDGARVGAQLVIVTHTAPDEALAATVDALSTMEIVRGVTSVMRVEGE